MRICISIFNICFLDFHFSNSEKWNSYLQREFNQNPEIIIFKRHIETQFIKKVQGEWENVVQTYTLWAIWYGSYDMHHIVSIGAEDFEWDENWNKLVMLYIVYII